jgi:predicted KAP-like P-loop ATPase
VTSAEEAVVIALNAPWGAGKSSFLNLVHEQLSALPTATGEQADGPLVVRFNPWNYSSMDQLVRMFFVELSTAIGTSVKRKKAKKFGERLEKLGYLASIFSGDLGEAMRDRAKEMQGEGPLNEVKSELRDLFRSLKFPVVVLIDDIDRLERDSLRLLFRLIRINADFPNITYVLAYSRLVVEKNLTEQDGVSGRDYLEKIVQVSFDLPPPDGSVLEGLLASEIENVLHRKGLGCRSLDESSALRIQATL